MYVFTLSGKIKPAVRMTRKGQYVDSQALEYKQSQSALGWEYRVAMQQNGWEMLPGKTPLCIRARVEMPSRLHCQDADNQLKAILDAAQGIVFPDDRWVDECAIRRETGAEYRAVVEIGVLGKEAAHAR